MAAANSLLVVGSSPGSPSLRGWLEPHGFAVEQALPASVPAMLPQYTAVVIDGRDGPRPEVVTLCRRLAQRPPDDRPPVVYLAPDDSPAARVVGFGCGADAVIGRSAGPDEFVAQVRVLERWQKAKEQWAARGAEAQQICQQLQQAYQQLDMDLRMARRLQASFLPKTLPEVGPVRFGVCYRPCGQVGGDFYDVFRLDESHVGFYVADAMGHGVPASLLTIFLKKALQTKEITDSGYRLLPPGEVLSRLNRDLMAQGLAELPFITMVYGLLNCHDGVLQFARAAHPHPVALPRAGEPEQWSALGTLLGIFEAEYPAQLRQLNPGDKLLVYTDGLPDDGGKGSGPPERLLNAAIEHRGQRIQTLVDRLAADLLTGQPQTDDVTLLGVEILAE
jgi:sigma-B regulation protein RsbU (phosphoserine phosphatase)